MILKNSVIPPIARTLGWRFPQRRPPADPRTIIVLKPCCLGDVVLATPAIAALKARYPRAEIDVAVGGWSRAVLQNNPHIRQLLDSGRVGQGRYGWGDVRRLAGQVRQRSYDLAVVLDRSPLLGVVPWLAGVRHRVGLDSAGRGFCHTLRVPVPTAPIHEAELYLRCVAALGGETGGFWTAFYPAEADQRALPPLPDGSFVIIHPAGGLNPGMKMLDKRWPIDRLAALADRFARRSLPVVLTGAGDDRPLCQAAAARMTAASPRIMAGALTLGQFGALCRRAALFVGGDTGAMHVAAAVGCKTVAIFGPSDPRRYGPFAPSDQIAVLWHPLALPEGGVGQGEVVGFSWERGVSVEEAWEACRSLLTG